MNHVRAGKTDREILAGPAEPRTASHRCVEVPLTERHGPHCDECFELLFYFVWQSPSGHAYCSEECAGRNAYSSAIERRFDAAEDARDDDR